jgi:IS30 family transposase
MGKPYKRLGFTASQSTEVWDRWQRGEGLTAIGRLLGKSSSSIFSHLKPYGGIRPRVRRRSERALSLVEREEISRGIAADESIRTIAGRLSRSPSTVGREISRNGGRRRYRATEAEKRALEQARRPKPCKLAVNPWLRAIVAEKLSQEWAPRQIAGWLKRTYPNDETRQVSHETIYKSLFVQARGLLKKELMQYLRSQRTMRHGRYKPKNKDGRGQIADAVSIRERPAEAKDRAVPGHWEGDLIVGSNNSHIATLVERHSRYVMLVRVRNKDTKTVIDALIRQARKLPKELAKSLTWDRGHELADHKRFSLATDIKVYFCDPSSPWQRGSNENTNGLLRQYFPKGIDLSGIHQNRLNAVARRLNGRPRETLGFETPAERLEACVASID